MDQEVIKMFTVNVNHNKCLSYKMKIEYQTE